MKLIKEVTLMSFRKSLLLIMKKKIQKCLYFMVFLIKIIQKIKKIKIIKKKVNKNRKKNKKKTS